MKAPFSSKKIATAAIGAAVSLLAVIGAFYIPNLSVSLNVIAAIGLLIPLSQKFYREAALAYIAAGGLGAIFTNIHILPFVMVTGLYTLFAIITYDKKVKWWITAPIGFVYGCLCFFILYQVTSLIALDLTKLKMGNLSPAAVYIILNAVFLIALAVYHFLILWINAYLNKLIAKIMK